MLAFQNVLVSGLAVALSLGAMAQDVSPTSAPETPETPAAATESASPIPTIDTGSTTEALPPTEVKRLQAVIMEVTGKARWRPDADSPWKTAAMNDVLDAGAEIRTATRSTVALRVGRNATVVVDSGTNFIIPEIIQEGSVLRTRAAVKAGRADFKVDEVGLTNDFQVITPSSTLAVRGTTFSVDWGGLSGLQVEGAATNRINAIEMRYFLANLQFFVSGEGQSTESSPEPAQAAWLDTVGGSTMMGQLSSSREFRLMLENAFALLGGYVDSKLIQNAAAGLHNSWGKVGGQGVPIVKVPPGDGGPVIPPPLTDFQKFQILCDNFNGVINGFQDKLDNELKKQLEYSLSPAEQMAFTSTVNQISNLCFFYDPDTTPDPLGAFVSYLQTYCNHLETPEATAICLDVADQVIMFTIENGKAP